MDEYPSNSQKKKPPTERERTAKEAPEIKAVVTSSVSRRKKPLGRRLRETFLGGDAQSVGSFVLIDVVVPAMKDLIVDSAEEMIRRVVFGEDARRPGRRSRSSRGRHDDSFFNYGGISRGTSLRREEPRREIRQASRSSFNFDEVILDRRVEADEVLEQMYNLLEKYELVTVANLYQLVNVEPSYTDAKWGWDNLQGSGVVRTRNGGYLLDLPEPQPIRD